MTRLQFGIAAVAVALSMMALPVVAEAPACCAKPNDGDITLTNALTRVTATLCSLTGKSIGPVAGEVSAPEVTSPARSVAADALTRVSSTACALGPAVNTVFVATVHGDALTRSTSSVCSLQPAVSPTPVTKTFGDALTRANSEQCALEIRVTKAKVAPRFGDALTRVSGVACDLRPAAQATADALTRITSSRCDLIGSPA